MNDGYGIEARQEPAHAANQPPARYLVLIDAGGSRIARLFLDSRKPVAEFDAAAEEVALMTQGLQASCGASGGEWDDALAGHSRDERAGADIYVIDV